MNKCLRFLVIMALVAIPISVMNGCSKKGKSENIEFEGEAEQPPDHEEAMQNEQEENEETPPQ